jgi:hypothetical protein
MVGPPRPRGEPAIGPDGQTQRPEANLSGRDPEGPVPPQDARTRHSRPSGYPGPTRSQRTVQRVASGLRDFESSTWRLTSSPCGWIKSLNQVWASRQRRV